MSDQRSGGGGGGGRNNSNRNNSRGGQGRGQQAGRGGRRGRAAYIGRSGIPVPAARGGIGRGTPGNASGNAASFGVMGRPDGFHDAPTGNAAQISVPGTHPASQASGGRPDPAASCGGQGTQSHHEVHAGCPGLGLHEAQKQASPNAETNPDMFYPPHDPGWQDQEDPAFEGMGYLDTDWICPTCLKTQADHEPKTCARACGTCRKHHSGHFCPLRYMSYNWYKNHGGRSPYVGEIKHFRPSEKDLVILQRKKIAYFMDFKPAQTSAKRKQEDEEPHVTRKKLNSRNLQVEVMCKRFHTMKQEASTARQQAAASEAEIERLRRVITELQGRPLELGPKSEPMDLSGGSIAELPTLQDSEHVLSRRHQANIEEDWPVVKKEESEEGG